MALLTMLDLLARVAFAIMLNPFPPPRMYGSDAGKKTASDTPKTAP